MSGEECTIDRPAYLTGSPLATDSGNEAGGSRSGGSQLPHREH